MTRSWILSLLWARKLIVLTATLACLLGGIAVILVSSERYLATARVSMDYILRDPITGGYLTNKTVDTYVLEQVNMIRDFQVAIPAVEALGWLDDPIVADAFSSNPALAGADYRQWVAQRLMGGTSASIVAGSNILQIEYRGGSPEQAMAIAEALRQAYIAANVLRRQEGAANSADAASERALRLKAALARAEQVRNDYSRAVGVLLEDDADDPESRSMARIASSIERAVASKPKGPDLIGAELVRVEALFEQASAAMGPRNPALDQLRRKRDTLRAQADARQGSMGLASNSTLVQSKMREQRLEVQKTKVLDQREEVLQLRLYQDEIDRYRKALNDTQIQIADLRQLTTSDAGGVTPVGAPASEPVPVFPNRPLILISSTILGLLFGGFLALLVELLHRRVRSVRDLELAAQTPILGVVPHVSASRTPRREAKPWPVVRLRGKLRKSAAT